MQKGFEMNMIVAIIIALVGVGVFIMLVNGDLQKSATSIYCKTFIKASTDPSDPAIPEMCKNQKPEYNVQEVKATDNKLFSRELLSYIIACFQKSDALKAKEKYTCFELSLKGGVQNVSEANVTEVLKKEDGCRSIENSDYGCGVVDQISWNVEGGIINDQRILFIEYDPAQDIVRVTG